MGFLCNTERIVTRALAIGFIAVCAGAAHSWLHGPLRPAGPTQGDRPVKAPPRPEAGERPAQPDGPQGGDPIRDPAGAPTGEATDDQPGQPGAEETPAPPEVPEGHISLEDAYAHWENGTATFIDTRSASIYSEGHIPGSLNLSLEMTGDPTAVNNVLQWITPGDTIILYCRGGLCDESKNVGELLNGAGYTNTLILGAGYPGWADAGYMTESGGG